jgi:cytokinin dehydrogenase
MAKISRRGLIQGLFAGAVVLGFDPTRRSWVTEASAADFMTLPPLDGTLATDPASLAAAADDFGNIIHRTPVAVLFPGSVNDIVAVVQFAGANGLRVAGRGQGHTPFGQCQADAGVVIDMSTLATIHSISQDQADVDAGVLWRDLLLATTAVGLTPPVLTDYTGLSIGGTLSVGGLNGTSSRYGAQVDNVDELQVVTGQGQIVTCSQWQNADLFNVALAGLGLCAIIVRAKVRLIPAGQLARTFSLTYADVPTMLDDMRLLVGAGNGNGNGNGGCGGNGGPGRFDHVRGQAAPGADGWVYSLECTSFYSPPEDPQAGNLLGGLDFIPGSLQISDYTYFGYCDIVYQEILELAAAGLLGLPHPWLDLFVPGSAVNTFAPQTIATQDPATYLPGALMLFYPLLASSLNQPLLSVPDEEAFFLFDILRTTTPDPTVVAAALAENRTFYDQNVALGGKDYVISAVQLSPADWKAHFGQQWWMLVQAKNHFDPGNVLGPGPGVFP